MRILYLDSSEIWSNNLARGFQANGHDVLISGPINEENLLNMIESFNPDFAITVGWGAEHTIEKQEIIRKSMETHKIPLVYWAVEDPAYTNNWSIPLVSKIKPDLVFTICPNTVHTYRRLGFPAYHLDFGYEETVHQPTTSCSEYEVDIAIVANAYPDKLSEYPNHYRHRSLDILIRPLLNENIRIDFWGDEWNRMNDYFGLEIPKEWIHGFINYKDANKVYSSSKIILGLQNYPDLLTQRTYEILGSKGFLLTLDTPGVRENFKPGKDLVISSSPQETVERIKYYLNHPEERFEIQRQGSKAVQAHTYKSRANQIIERLFKNGIIKSRLSNTVGLGNLIHYGENHNKTYQVQKGDTLYKISKTFNISIEDLKAFNGLTSDLIFVDQILKLSKDIN